MQSTAREPALCEPILTCLSTLLTGPYKEVSKRDSTGESPDTRHSKDPQLAIAQKGLEAGALSQTLPYASLLLCNILTVN